MAHFGIGRFKNSDYISLLFSLGTMEYLCLIIGIVININAIL